VTPPVLDYHECLGNECTFAAQPNNDSRKKVVPVEICLGDHPILRPLNFATFGNVTEIALVSIPSYLTISDDPPWMHRVYKNCWSTRGGYGCGTSDRWIHADVGPADDTVDG
jgi:hypothetical protein